MKGDSTHPENHYEQVKNKYKKVMYVPTAAVNCRLLVTCRSVSPWDHSFINYHY